MGDRDTNDNHDAVVGDAGRAGADASATSAEVDVDKFQVDLAGIIRLLGDSLYSGPHVVIRELCQNGLDAVTQRGDCADVRPAVQLIPLTGDSPGLLCLDSGIGLTPESIEQFLATVGRSSKRRDDEPLADLVGQFGIGLLSAFLIADQIELFSKVDSGDVVSWVGSSDGTFSTTTTCSLTEWCGNAHSDTVNARLSAWFEHGPGTVLRIVPRPHHREWVSPQVVTKHAQEALSGVSRRIVLVDSDDHDTVIAPTVQPWEMSRLELRSWSEDFVQSPVLDTLTLSIPALGLRGVAVIPAHRVPPTVQAQHVARIKGVTVDDECSSLLPPWAFFVKLLVDCVHLNPTTSRESIRDDEQLETVRTELSRQLLSWIVGLSRDRLSRQQFLKYHATGLMGVALSCDEDTLGRLMEVIEFETTLGTATLPQLLDDHDTIHVASSVDEFRQVATVASQVGICVINGGYTFAQETVLRAARIIPAGDKVSMLAPDQLRADLMDPHPDDSRALTELIRAVPEALAGPDVDLMGKVFVPNSVAAILLTSVQAQRDDHRLTLESEVDDEFSQLLKQTAPAKTARPQLVLNTSNSTIQEVLRSRSRPELAAALLQSVYARALLHGQHPVSPADARLIDRSMGVLVKLASAAAGVESVDSSDNRDPAQSSQAAEGSGPTEATEGSGPAERRTDSPADQTSAEPSDD